MKLKLVLSAIALFSVLVGGCASVSPTTPALSEDVSAALKPFYSNTGRPSIDPDLMMRMLIVGYAMGIRSERRLCEEVHLNLAYRLFCKLGNHRAVPNNQNTRVRPMPNGGDAIRSVPACRMPIGDEARRLRICPQLQRKGLAAIDRVQRLTGKTIFGERLKMKI